MKSKAAGILARIRTAERGLFARLHARRAKRDAPFNYKSLAVEGNQVRYVDLSGRLLVVGLDEIEKVEFVREEAAFDDLCGPYLETKWQLHARGADAVEIMDEKPDRKALVRAFVRALPGFRETTVAVALASPERGRWLCFDRCPTGVRP